MLVKQILIDGVSRIISLIFILLVFAVPLAFNTHTTEVYGLIKIVLIELLVFWAFICWIIKMNVENSFSFNRLSFNPPILIYLGINILSLLKAYNLSEAQKALAQLISGIMLFFIVLNNLKGEKEVKKLLNALIISAVLVCLFDFWQGKGINFTAHRDTHLSTLGHPNFVAEFLVMVLPFTLAFFYFETNPFKKLCYFISITCMLILLLLTRSRGAWLGFSVSVFAMVCAYIFFLNPPKRKKIIMKLSVSILSVVIIIFLLGLFCPRKYKQGFLLPIKERALSVFSATNYTNRVRLLIWKNTLKLARDYPLLGVGVGNFKVIYPKYRSLEEIEFTGYGIRHTKAHNEFLEILVETGIIGLASFLLIIYLLGKSLILIQKKFKKMGLGLLGCFIGLGVVSNFSYTLHIPTTSMLFWFMLGIVGYFAAPVDGGIKKKTLLLNKLNCALIWILLISMTIFLPALIIRPIMADIYQKKGFDFFKQRKYRKALLAYEKSLLYDPDDLRTNFLRGNAYLKRGGIPEAVQSFKKANKLYPYYAFIYNNLGAAYLKMKDFKSAKESYLKAIELEPSYKDARYNLGMLYYLWGFKKEAAIEFKWLIEQGDLRAPEIAKALILIEPESQAWVEEKLSIKQKNN